MEELSLFDFLPEEESARFKPIKSNDWKWTFADYPKEKNGLKVFSCFACGGGSTMGYKLAGCEVVGCCEIDPQMNKVYVKNHHPKHNFLMDIRDFNKIPNDQLPKELFDLDILDGSPPCTTFSMAGQREETWGKEKVFREGQKAQTLDDLSFVFIQTIKKLNPKVVIMENVEGLILGEAFTYVQRIYKELDDIGYKVHHWLLKSEQMGVPQARHRVFFVAVRKTSKTDVTKINMSFNYEAIPYKAFKSENEKIAQGMMSNAVKNIRGNESVAEAMYRIYGKKSGITHRVAKADDVYPTQTAGRHYDIWTESGNHPSDEDIAHASTFPEDYDFDGQTVSVVCGMCVPPLMTKRIVKRLIDEGVFNYKLVKAV